MVEKMKIKDIDGHFFQLPKCCRLNVLFTSQRKEPQFQKDGKAGASIMAVLVREAVAAAAASLLGSG